ncbi:hypothetical protein PCC7424_5437 (plasmid) [Gloeothece citriformis PCC 7424]|uniref:Uncharacterized protein n=1 Tax=Gloeothece citriformis (strain PCC 7424) TaxID=65393 RepID=B7KMI9_GLOC7|nr:hypothetical protein PCC7424_5437 [Gloeothece citriformis PCC 7424]
MENSEIELNDTSVKLAPKNREMSPFFLFIFTILVILFYDGYCQAQNKNEKI